MELDTQVRQKSEDPSQVAQGEVQCENTHDELMSTAPYLQLKHTFSLRHPWQLVLQAEHVPFDKYMFVPHVDSQVPEEPLT